VKIGTPLSPSASKVMLLGSGELGKEVIIALQRLGVEVIAVDRYDNAPGQQVAQRSYTIDMADGVELRKLIESVKPDLVVPEIEAIATDTLAEIEAEGITEVIPTARATQLTMNREGIRRLAAEELGILCSAYAFASSQDELQAAIDQHVGYPCIIKPVMSSSGKGQSRINTADDVDSAWNYAMSGGRVNSGRIIVEAVVEFDYEITLLTVRSVNIDGDIVTSFCQPIGHRQEKGDYVESWQPQPMTEPLLKKAQKMAEKVTASLGGRGIFGVELFIKGDEVYFSEVSPRPHDTGLVTLMTQWQSEFALHARAILGLPVDTSLRDSGASAVIYGGLDEKAIAFEQLELALADTKTELRLFGKPESFIRRRMGVALAVDDDIMLARKKAKKAADLVKPVSAKS